MPPQREPFSSPKLLAAYLAVPVGHKLLAAFVTGAIAGAILGPSALALQPAGDIFVSLLRLLVVPIVVSTILAGLSSTRLGLAARVGGRVVAIYLATAYAASVCGVVAVFVLQAGAGMTLPRTGAAPVAAPGSDSDGARLPEQIVRMLAGGGLLGVTVASVLLALTIAELRERWPSRLTGAIDYAVDGLARGVRVVLNAIMQYAPLAVFALVAATFGRSDQAVAGHLVRLFASVYAGQAAVVLLLLLLLVVAAVPLRGFLGGVRAPLLTAFATGSSAATLPVELQSAGDALRLDRRTFGFSLPLGAAINKTGTAVHLSAIAAFASHIGGHPLTLEQAAAVTLGGFVASVATPPISGGSYVVMAGMLGELGLPLGVIAVTAGVPFLGKLNTPINSLGRLVGTVLVSRQAGAPAAPAAGAHRF